MCTLLLVRAACMGSCDALGVFAKGDDIEEPCRDIGMAIGGAVSRDDGEAVNS